MATSKAKAPAGFDGKKKAAKKTSTKRSGPPKGMKQVVGGYAKTWNVDQFDTIEGVVKEPPKTVELRQGRKTVDRRCIEVDTSDDRYTVWESAGLVNLFEVLDEQKMPCRVWIQFKGYGTAKKGQNAPKLFDSAVG